MDTDELLKANGIDPNKLKTLTATYIDAKGKRWEGADALKRKEKDQARQIKKQELVPNRVMNSPQHWLDKFITQDPAMLKVKQQVLRLANEPDPVLITGPTGTGKELIARALHGNRQGDFVAINCGGFPEHLFESEMFGHVRGSFTGAVGDKIGLIQQAHGGTLFIDELSRLPEFMQGKLLRALQEKTIRPVGSNQELSFDCRIVSATNRNIEHLIEGGEFAEDLYWRISTIELELSSLKLRWGDIALILKSFGVKPDDITIDAVDGLPGNVRELQRIARRHKLGLL